MYAQQNYVPPHEAHFQNAQHTSHFQNQQHTSHFQNPQAEGQSFAYNKGDIRQSFATKVFTIVAVQLGLTFVLNLICHLSPTLSALALNLAPVWVIGTVFFILTLSCFRDLARRVPTNYYLLLGFTVCEAMALYAGTYYVEPETLLMALFYTAVSVGLLAFFAANTSYDFTNASFIGYFLMAHLAFNLAGFWLFGGSMFYTYVGTLAFTVYLVIDLQMILGRKEVALGVDEYVFAALNLYTDVVQLFVRILEILNKQSEKDKKNRRHAYRK